MAILAPLAACGSKDGAQAPPPAPVTVVQVEPSAMPLSIEYVGETAGFREVEVRARVSGILLKR
ncbi:MAG: efflux transporter periplasmic adaptor subunit, partial [Dokdonella sp.]|nr:efflux transporter periplasmic adaptor subunit [Dokdonella sp.]